MNPDDEGSLNEKPVSFLVDLKRVCDTVRNENSEALSYSGRVKALTAILEIDKKGHISNNMADPIHRKSVFVASKYGKAPAKSSSVMSWKRSRRFYF